MQEPLWIFLFPEFGSGNYLIDWERWTQYGLKEYGVGTNNIPRKDNWAFRPFILFDLHFCCKIHCITFESTCFIFKQFFHWRTLEMSHFAGRGYFG